MKANSESDDSFEHYVVLYTSQKHKKTKVWQDGFLKYFSSNAKIVLYDDNNTKIDSLFAKGRTISVGDELEFDRHLVTVESLKSSNENLVKPVEGVIPSVKRRKIGLNRPTSFNTPLSATNTTERTAENTVDIVSSRALLKPNGKITSEVKEGDTIKTPTPVPLKNIFKSSPLSLEFPSISHCELLVRNKEHLIRRARIPTLFSSALQYREIFTHAIYEHLQILLNTLSIQFRMLFDKYNKQKMPNINNVEYYFRSHGMGFYKGCGLRLASPQNIFPTLGRNMDSSSYPNSSELFSDVCVELEIVLLQLSEKEHHSVYSKDDMWVVSSSVDFEPASTFLARSTFYGPFSDSTLEIQCIFPRDSEIARSLAKNTQRVFALRLINVNAEMMMLDNLRECLTNSPLLPLILKHSHDAQNILAGPVGPGRFKPPLIIPIKSRTLPLMSAEEAMEIGLQDVIERTILDYHLNEDQTSVLRRFSEGIIAAINSESPPSPIFLVHGVFGAGKSYLIAVLVIFVQRVFQLIHRSTKSNDNDADDAVEEFAYPFQILITSITNVAVDRILLQLLDLEFEEFARVGSIKKIAKRILPFTAQRRQSSDEELKELKSILDDDQISSSERRLVQETIRRFKQSENQQLLKRALVVGTTCMASMLDIFGDMKFRIAILDEASQITEPMALVPLCRFGCERLIMVGDPLQLPPTIQTKCDLKNIDSGLDRSLFNRLVELNHKPILLRTQYRCHPQIAGVCNSLFYSSRLLNGVSDENRSPIVNGLPTLCFLNIPGNEKLDPGSKSLYNQREIDVIIRIITRLLELQVRASEIGVIALYKMQASKIEKALQGGNERNTSTNKKSGLPQVSTVDAFQGAEREIIILSCVRSEQIGFANNPLRINVALSRARRHLILVGNAEFLRSNKMWKNIIDYCKGFPNGYIEEHLMRGLMQEMQQIERSAIESMESEEELCSQPAEKESFNEPLNADEAGYDEDYSSDLNEEQSTSTGITSRTKRSERRPIWAIYQEEEEEEREGGMQGSSQLPNSQPIQTLPSMQSKISDVSGSPQDRKHKAQGPTHSVYKPEEDQDLRGGVVSQIALKKSPLRQDLRNTPNAEKLKNQRGSGELEGASMSLQNPSSHHMNLKKQEIFGSENQEITQSTTHQNEAKQKTRLENSPTEEAPLGGTTSPFVTAKQLAILEKGERQEMKKVLSESRKRAVIQGDSASDVDTPDRKRAAHPNKRGAQFIPPLKQSECEEEDDIEQLKKDYWFYNQESTNRTRRNPVLSKSKPSEQDMEPTDERLRNIEPRMIEMIQNEIMDKSQPVSWDDIAGLEHAKKTIKEVVTWPMMRPDIFYGLRGPPKGLLLFGPPGTGKTLIGKCIASQSGATFFSISSSSLTSKWVGDGEKMVRALFAVARVYQPSVVFIDEIDSLLTQRTDGEFDATRRMKTEFLIQFDGVTTDSDKDRILVVGATNRPQELDEAARRRFRKRLYIPLPECEARCSIVKNLLQGQKHSLTEEEIMDIGKLTEGYSGSDMDGLCREAALGPIRSIRDITSISAEDVRPIQHQDFLEALTQIRASVSDKDLNMYEEWNRTYGSMS
ncbi:uncharacterized protein VTP21DRAFT_9311 [Calcarisporiella thermophila]|uniref:uncharacterized protein n=1 Tax=Calcarisporiella thermophila TaxID=911321 RepID=UPI00374335DF